MKEKTILQLAIRRLVILFMIAIAFVWLFSEGAHLLQNEENDRAPKVIELVIPAGSAGQLAAGEQINILPEEMVFVVGDRLAVKNEDIVDHQLGPLWVPAGASASLLLDKPNKYQYECSFQTRRYLGLEVRPPTTWATRLTAVVIAAPTTAIFLFLYSILIWPLDRKQKKSEGGALSLPGNQSTSGQ